MRDDNRTEFLMTVRKALGRECVSEGMDVADATGLSDSRAEVGERVEMIKHDGEVRAKELMDDLLSSAEEAGWIVRQSTLVDSAGYIHRVAEEAGAKSVLQSDHEVLDEIGLDTAFVASSIELRKIAYDDSGKAKDSQRAIFREDMIVADIGVTGVRYAIAETGSVSIDGGKGASRLISLLPPIHVAVIRPSQILSSLDELFTMRRNEFYQTGKLDYTNIISGPSRSADIEQTLIKGMHGPREVHMIVVT